MDTRLKAIEVTGTIDDRHQLHLDEPLPGVGPSRVRAIILVPEERDVDEREWQWDEFNRREIQRHGVTEADAERAAIDLGFLLGVAERGGELRTSTLGRTADGRLLMVVTTRRGELTRVITARDASRKERRIWRQWYERV